MDRIQAYGVATNDRRRHVRIPVRRQIHFQREGEDVLMGETANISCDGIYVNLRWPCVPGEIVEFTVDWGPTRGPGRQSDTGTVTHCVAEVIRVDVRGVEPVYGVALRLLPTAD